MLLKHLLLRLYLLKYLEVFPEYLNHHIKVQPPILVRKKPFLNFEQDILPPTHRLEHILQFVDQVFP